MKRRSATIPSASCKQGARFELEGSIVSFCPFLPNPPGHALGAQPDKKSCVWHTVRPNRSSTNPGPPALYLEEQIEPGDAAGDGLHGAGLCRLPGTALKLQHPVSAAARAERRGPAGPLPSAPGPFPQRRPRVPGPFPPWPRASGPLPVFPPPRFERRPRAGPRRRR